LLTTTPIPEDNEMAKAKLTIRKYLEKLERENVYDGHKLIDLTIKDVWLCAHPDASQIDGCMPIMGFSVHEQDARVFLCLDDRESQKWTEEAEKLGLDAFDTQKRLGLRPKAEWVLIPFTV
jgi:hypothetical protein